MASTMRVSQNATQTLDELQARLFLLTRKRLNKQDLLDIVLEVGPDLERVAAKVLGLKYPVSKAAWNRVRRRVFDWGVETREEDINRVLYGWDR
jgi:hypothetical protein